MLTKEEFYEKIYKKFKVRKMSIDFWAGIFYEAYKRKKMEMAAIMKLLAEVNQNQT